MTDDTTTWLKKNPVINPLRRSLKTSLRFHVNASEMDASIMSNPGKSKEQKIIVPRALQRPSMRMLKAKELKVPGALTSKPDTSGLLGSGKGPKLPLPRKSFLPVKNKPHSSEKRPLTSSVVRASFLPRNSAKKNTCRHDLMQRTMEAVKNSTANGNGQMKTVVETGEAVDGSIIRSILKKKRASLRRSLLTSSGKKKSKPVKKVLFEGFESVVDDEKENESVVYPVVNQSDCDFGALDEPTAFFNFPKSNRLESSPMERQTSGTKEEAKETEDDDEKSNLSEIKIESSECENSNGLSVLLNSWNTYLANLKHVESMRNSLKDSIKARMEQDEILHNQFKLYLKNCDELREEMTRLGKDLEENFKKLFSIENQGDTLREKDLSFHSLERKKRDKGDKIRLSDKSRAIKKNTTKTNSALKSGLWRSHGSEEGFSLVETKGVFHNK